MRRLEVDDREIGYQIGYVRGLAEGALGYGLYSQAMFSSLLVALRQVDEFDEGLFQDSIHRWIAEMEEAKPSDDSVAAAYRKAIELLGSRLRVDRGEAP